MTSYAQKVSDMIAMIVANPPDKLRWCFACDKPGQFIGVFVPDEDNPFVKMVYNIPDNRKRIYLYGACNSCKDSEKQRKKIEAKIRKDSANTVDLDIS